MSFIPPKGFQTLRYYGTYSNKARGIRNKSPSSSDFTLQTSNFPLLLPATNASGASVISYQ
jgi:hypothetical protein